MFMRYYILSFSLLISTFTYAQNFQSLFDDAVSKYKLGEHERSQFIFNQVLFYGPSNLKGKSYYFIAIVNKDVYKNNASAKNLFDLAYNNLLDDDSLKVECLIQKSQIFISENKYGHAILELFSINNPIEKQKNRVNFYLANCFFLNNEFDKADSCFSLLIEDKNKLMQMRSDIKKAKEIKKPNSILALIYSAIIPGAGLAYSGEFTSAFSSFVLISVILTTTYLLSVNVGVLDAVFISLPWFQRYYSGGMNQAYNMASIKRNESKNKILNSINLMILNSIN
jgi:hypothetical protein